MPGHSGIFGRGDSIDSMIIDICKAFKLVPHDRLLTKLAAWGVDLRVVVCVRELVVGRIEMVRVGGQLLEEVKVSSECRKGGFGHTNIYSLCK